jgi:hypothetical protein
MNVSVKEEKKKSIVRNTERETMIVQSKVIDKESIRVIALVSELNKDKVDLEETVSFVTRENELKRFGEKLKGSHRITLQ